MATYYADGHGKRCSIHRYPCDRCYHPFSIIRLGCRKRYGADFLGGKVATTNAATLQFSVFWEATLSGPTFFPILISSLGTYCMYRTMLSIVANKDPEHSRLFLDKLITRMDTV